MADLLGTLIDMGFPKEKAEKALSNTGGDNLEAAINWIISDQERGEVSVTPKLSSDSDPKIEVDEESSVEVTAEPVDTTARSLKCNDCGKLFRSEDEMQFHAAKSGHVNFSESTEELKPLTEEERRQRVNALQERLKLKRAEKEENEKRDALELEKSRRRTGQEMLMAKQRIEEQEMKKVADERKRQKKEDLLTKQRILEQIKTDREAKKRAATEDITAQPQKPATANAEISPKPVNAPKNYDECQLQIRLLNGQVLKHSFKAKESLSAVRLYVQMQMNDFEQRFSLMTNFPKRVFTDTDMDTPLTELGADVLRIWKLLRDRAVRIQRVRLNSTGSGANKTEDWPFWQAMSFLFEKDQTDSTLRFSNVTESSPATEILTDEDEEITWQNSSIQRAKVPRTARGNDDFEATIDQQPSDSGAVASLDFTASTSTLPAERGWKKAKPLNAKKSNPSQDKSDELDHQLLQLMSDEGATFGNSVGELYRRAIAKEPLEARHFKLGVMRLMMELEEKLC